MFDPHTEFTSLPRGPASWSGLNREFQRIAAKHAHGIPGPPVAFVWNQAVGSGWVLPLDGGSFLVQDPRTPETTP